jgi:hypothetical protein
MGLVDFWIQNTKTLRSCKSVPDDITQLEKKVENTIEQNTAYSVLSYRLAGCPVLNSKRKAESARALVRHGLSGGLLCRTCERFNDGSCKSFMSLQQQKPG